MVFSEQRAQRKIQISKAKNKTTVVKSLFNEQEARMMIRRYPKMPAELALRVYTSRLLGGDPSLVLHGGGNTSAKIPMPDIAGKSREILFIKGSGNDLAGIEPSGFAGVELEPLRRLAILDSLPDEEMENELQIHKISARSPDPSVEVLLHAFLPHRFIDHTHAEAILILTGQPDGKDIFKELLGARAVFLPYCRPGFPLAKAALGEYGRNPEMEALVVAGHGIFTFGKEARTAYERMAAFVGKAETYIRSKTRGRKAGAIRRKPPAQEKDDFFYARLTQIIRGAAAVKTEEGGFQRFYTEVRATPEMICASLLPEAADFCSSGVLTPDHAIRTKNKWAFIARAGEDDAALKETVCGAFREYRERYDRDFSAQTRMRGVAWKKLDSNPRVCLVAGAGLITLGFTPLEARTAADIAERNLRAKILSRRLGKYEPIAEEHVWEMEYWGPQRRKLDLEAPPLLRGQVAVVTGAGGAIGLGIADRLLAAGAAVVLGDIAEKSLGKVHALLAERYGKNRLEKIPFDVTRYESVERAFAEISRRLGGIDILVPNAGIAHVAKVEDLDSEKFRRVIEVNLIGTFHTIKACVPVFRRQGTGGNIVVVSSKNVFDPGASFGAYSASKAGAHQISKIAALELADLGVRVNLVNPDAVFGDEEVPSKLWEVVGPERMKSRGLDPEGLKEYYRRRNLLKVRVTAEHVGNAVVFFASGLTPTTGATLPIDGGIPAAFPR
jgi:rhamnose utilization protein RhaD (predicted bifunctional aldolase and dehydrogenase)/NAD(P)-dependent dehydrogenase (short-subunit alcohol dehydrogenase family)